MAKKYKDLILEPVPPVYNVARRLRIQLNRSTQKAPVNDKRGIIAQTERAITEIMKACLKANRCPDTPELRAAFLEKASELLIEVELNVRVMLDLNIMKPPGFDQMTRIADDIRAQLYGWLKSTRQQ